jgi:hypothetical protein
MKENYLKIPAFDKIVDAYLRFMIEGKISRSAMESELTSYLKVFDLKDIKRSFASFSEKDLIGKLIYRFLSRFERRSLNAIGLLDETTAGNILTADRVRPDLIPLLVKAERLQGSLTFREKIRSNITERITKGFELPGTFNATMLKIEYAQSAIDYLVQANQLDIQTTIDEARLKEVDQNYTNAFIDRDEYAGIVTDIIKNPAIAKEHIDILDIARKRTDIQRVREEGNLAVSYELAAFSQGAVTTSEFEEVAAAMGKKPDEIETLEKARVILLSNKTRIVKFGTLQYLLAKRQITRDQFLGHASKLPIDVGLAGATADKIIAQSLAKAKSTPAKADESIFKYYPSIP